MTNEKKLTVEELCEIFGENMPAAALAILQNPNLTPGMARQKLTELAMNFLPAERQRLVALQMFTTSYIMDRLTSNHAEVIEMIANLADTEHIDGIRQATEVIDKLMQRTDQYAVKNCHETMKVIKDALEKLANRDEADMNARNNKSWLSPFQPV